jgi:hypothetical protein
MSELESYEDQLRAELSAMTVKELRQYAREHDLIGSLGSASTKAAIRSEIVVQMRHRKWLELEGGE